MFQAISQLEVPQGDELGERLKNFVLSELDRRFGEVERIKTYAVATMLDPRFKKLHFSKPTALANAMSTIQDAINEMLRTKDNAAAEQLNQHAVRAAETASDDIWSLHDEAAASQSVHPAEDVAGGFAVKLRPYVNRPVLDRNSNPFEAWVTLKTEYPHLYTLSLKYLPTINLYFCAGRKTFLCHQVDFE